MPIHRSHAQKERRRECKHWQEDHSPKEWSIILRVKLTSPLKRPALMWTTGSVDSPGLCSATLQSPSRWLSRAVVIGLAFYGRAYWHRASQARTLNHNPAPEAEAVPLCTLAA